MHVRFLAVKRPCEGRNAAERAAKWREVGLSRLKDFPVFHLCFGRRVMSKQDEDFSESLVRMSHPGKQQKENSSIFYTDTTLKLHFALIPFTGKTTIGWLNSPHSYNS